MSLTIEYTLSPSTMAAYDGLVAADAIKMGLITTAAAKADISAAKAAVSKATRKLRSAVGTAVSTAIVSRPRYPRAYNDIITVQPVPETCPYTGLPAYDALTDAARQWKSCGRQNGGALAHEYREHRPEYKQNDKFRSGIVRRFDGLFIVLAQFIHATESAEDGARRRRPFAMRGMMMTCTSIDSVVVDYGFGDVQEYTLPYLLLEHPIIAPRVARMVAGAVKDANLSRQAEVFTSESYLQGMFDMVRESVSAAVPQRVAMLISPNK